MHLHSNGKQDYIDDLNKQKDIELKNVNDRKHPKEQKKKFIKRILDKFNQLIKDSDQSIFIKESQL